MSSTFIKKAGINWSKPLQFLFRLVFVYFLVQIIPVDPKFYTRYSHDNFPGLHYGDIFNLAHYYPSWFSGFPTFADWIIYLLIAFISAFIWTMIDKNKSREYNNLYYWLRVILKPFRVPLS